jgi:hypothetical protein
MSRLVAAVTGRSRSHVEVCALYTGGLCPAYAANLTYVTHRYVGYAHAAQPTVRG